MAVNGVGSSNPYTKTNSKSGTDETNPAAQRSNKASNMDTGLSVNDFLNLIASQFQNQDMMNPMKDTEFMSQLAQFASLQAMQNLTEISTTNYGVSLLGKEITAAAMNSSGELIVKSGVVTGVSLFEGVPVVYIDKDAYLLSQIMAVGKLPEPDKEEGDEEGDKEEGDKEEGTEPVIDHR